MRRARSVHETSTVRHTWSAKDISRIAAPSSTDQATRKRFAANAAKRITYVFSVRLSDEAERSRFALFDPFYHCNRFFHGRHSQARCHRELRHWRNDKTKAHRRRSLSNLPVPHSNAVKLASSSLPDVTDADAVSAVMWLPKWSELGWPTAGSYSLDDPSCAEPSSFAPSCA